MSLLVGTLLFALAVLSALLGCAFLALSQNRNWRDIVSCKPSERMTRLARMAGCTFVFASLVFCVIRDGASFAALLWPLLFATAAFTIAMTLAYQRGLMGPLASALRWIARHET